LDSKILQNRFNTFFKDDLYGKYRDDDNLILSSGSLSPDEFPLCYALRYPIEFAMLKNWYGYSDSLGHLDSRKAIADLMHLRMPSYDLEASNIALTNGVTNGITTVLQTLKKLIGDEFRILTNFPTYSPFYTSCNSIAPVDTVMLDEGYINAEQIVNAINSNTKIVLLLGDLNPLRQMISISSLNSIIQFCAERKIWVVFDEAGAVYPEYDYRDLIKSP
jgi:aspartate/methionine/tyrosine aminotransferase